MTTYRPWGLARRQARSLPSLLSTVSVACFLFALYLAKLARTDVGSFFGAIFAMWVGEWLGRKKTIMLGTTLMLIGMMFQDHSLNTTAYFPQVPSSKPPHLAFPK